MFKKKKMQHLLITSLLATLFCTVSFEVNAQKVPVRVKPVRIKPAPTPTTPVSVNPWAIGAGGYIQVSPVVKTPSNPVVSAGKNTNVINFSNTRTPLSAGRVSIPSMDLLEKSVADALAKNTTKDLLAIESLRDIFIPKNFPAAKFLSRKGILFTRMELREGVLFTELTTPNAVEPFTVIMPAEYLPYLVQGFKDRFQRFNFNPQEGILTINSGSAIPIELAFHPGANFPILQIDGKPFLNEPISLEKWNELTKFIGVGASFKYGEGTTITFFSLDNNFSWKWDPVSPIGEPLNFYHVKNFELFLNELKAKGAPLEPIELGVLYPSFQAKVEKALMETGLYN